MEKRYNGKCLRCKKRFSVLAEREKNTVFYRGAWCGKFVSGSSLFYSPPMGTNVFELEYPCDCGGSARLKSVFGKVVADKKCDGRCMGATGHVCECACGGKNHGAAHG